MRAFNSQEKQSYIEKFGWSASRVVELPCYLKNFNTPENVNNIISNIHGLELTSITGRKRTFVVDKCYLDDFADEVNAACNDTGLEFKLFPIGQMSEFSGVLVVDSFTRFYRVDDGDVYFYGDNFEDFCDAIIFNNRTALEIKEHGIAYYCYNNLSTGIYFDVVKGWQGSNNHLYPVRSSEQINK